MPDEAFLPGLPGPDDDTRLLRRLKIPARYDDGGGDGASEEKRGLFVDCETTGFDSESDSVIELAALPFSYDAQAGAICRALPAETGQWLHDPGKPIPAEITRITGIDDAMVAGKKIDAAALSALVEKSDLIVAHNARFDARFARACARLSATSRGLARSRMCRGTTRGANRTNCGCWDSNTDFFTTATARWPIARRACICWRRFACRASATKPRLRRCWPARAGGGYFSRPTARLSRPRIC